MQKFLIQVRPNRGYNSEVIEDSPMTGVSLESNNKQMSLESNNKKNKKQTNKQTNKQTRLSKDTPQCKEFLD